MQIFNTILSYVGILLWVFGIYLVAFSKLRGIIGRAVVVVWQKKYLWLLALFAGIPSYGGEINFLFRKLNTVTSLQSWLNGFRNAIVGGDVERLWRASKTLWVHNFGTLAGYLGIFLLIFAVLTWLVIMSQAAIVRVVGRLQQNKPTGLIDGLTIGVEKFWTLVQLNIIGLLVGWAAWVILTAVPAAIYLLNHANGWSFVAFIGSLLSIVVSVIVIFLVQFSTANIVLNDTKLMPAMVDSWRLFKSYMVPSLEMAIAVFTINLTISSVVVSQVVTTITPFTLAGFLTILAIIILLYVLLSALSFTAWTMFYLQLVAGKSDSKLGQWTNRLVNFSGQKRAVS